MCHRNDGDLSFFNSIKDIEWKPLKNALACAVIGDWEGMWSVFDSRYGILDSLREC